MRVAAELHDLLALALQLAKADGVADGGRIAVDLGGKIQLNDIPLLELAIGGTGDRVTGGCLREHVHGQALILSAVFIQKRHSRRARPPQDRASPAP